MDSLGVEVWRALPGWHGFLYFASSWYLSIGVEGGVLTSCGWGFPVHPVAAKYQETPSGRIGVLFVDPSILGRGENPRLGRVTADDESARVSSLVIYG